MGTEKKKPRILLADDHRILAEGVENLLKSEYDVVGHAENGRAMLKMFRALKPDIIIADISMPLLNGIEAVRQIKEVHPDTKVIFLTMHPDVIYAAKAFDAGANGYLLKHSASDELSTAVNSVLKGQTYITPMIAGELMESYRRPEKHLKEKDLTFTSRQREVLQLIVEGRTASEIADILCISSRTVEFHKYKMINKLKLKSTAELIQYALKNKLV